MPTRRSTSLFLCCGAAGAALTAGSALAQGTVRHALSGEAAVYDLAGSVRVVAGSGRDVVVEVTPRGRDAEKLRVARSTVRGHDAVHVAFPEGDVVYPAMGRSNTRSRVRADGTFGDVNAGGFFSARETTVRGSGSGTEAWADMTVSVPSGGRLTVHLLAGDAMVTNVDGALTFDLGAATLATERTRGSLTVDAGSGRVRIAGAQGDINLDLGSGSADLHDVDASRLKVDGGSGSLVAANLRAPDIDLDLGSGSARLSGVATRTFKLDAGSGSVDVDFVGDVDDVRIDSGSGSVTLRLPPSLGATLDVDTSSGGITADVPVTVTRKEHDHLTGRIGDGEGHIRIDGGSGGVRLVKSGGR